MHISKKEGFCLIMASAAGFFCAMTLMRYDINGQAGLNGPDLGSNITRAMTDTGKAALKYVVLPTTVVGLGCVGLLGLDSIRHRHR